jgi:tRNA pseudouridine38-40 synthase
MPIDSKEVVNTQDKALVRNAAIVEYHGAHFHGWQRQKHHPEPTIQAALEDALSRVANENITVICAGRTDAGVHASTQVIHFDTHAIRRPHNWMMGVNTYLPDGIAIRWISQVDQSFHARFGATSRRYRYLIFNKEIKQGLMHDQLTWCRFPLDENKMHEAAQSLLGKHDFTSYRAAGCQAKNAIRTVQDISVRRYGDIVMLEVQANAFLYHMIRNIAGVLMPIGMGRKPIEWSAELLAQKDRSVGGITAPSAGLYFVGVEYSDEFAIPSDAWGPVFVEPWLSKA